MSSPDTQRKRGRKSSNKRNIKLTTKREILFYGDSLTYGMHHSQAARYKTTWPQLIEERINDIGYRVVESALCSRTTVHDDPEDQEHWMPGSTGSDFNGIHHFGPLFSSHTPSILIIALGTNDLKVRIRKVAKDVGQRKSSRKSTKNTAIKKVLTAAEEAEIIAENCAKIGEKARLMYTGFCHTGTLKIMILTPPKLVYNENSKEMGYDQFSEEISLHFPNAYAKMCKKHNFINISTTPPSMENSVDGVHFTEKAQAIVAENVWTDLKNDVDKNRPTTRARRKVLSAK